MAKRLLFPFIVSILCLSVSAQSIDLHQVNGIVTDSLDNPISLVAVQLFANEQAVAAALTNDKGEFIITNVSSGDYIVKFSHAACIDQAISIHLSSNMTMAQVRLKQKVTSFEEVTVIANKIDHSADRYKVSLKNDPITVGKTASEVLNYLPAVNSRESSITIFGRSVSRVLVNGVVISDMVELKAIQAENIEDIEVVYLSGVGESSMGGGELHITLKKPATGGYYGSISNSLSLNFENVFQANSTTSTISYRNKKWSIYNFIIYNPSEKFSDENNITRYKDTDITKEDERKNRGDAYWFSERLSITYDINKNHMIGANFVYGSPHNSTTNTSSLLFFDNQGNEFDNLTSFNDNHSIANKYQATLQYRWTLDDKGSDFELKADYLFNDSDNERKYKDTYNLGLQNQSESFMNSTLDNTVDQYYLDARFNIKAGGKGNIELGANYNNNNTDQLLNYTDLENDIWVTNTTLSDEFKLKGDNYAAFASFGSAIGQKFMYKLGTRVDRREIEYNSIKVDKTNKKEYNHIGASADLIYMLNPEKGNMLMLAYRRDLEPIPYSAITPVITYHNEYSYTKGNLDIEPASVNTIMLNLMLEQKWTLGLVWAYSDSMWDYQTFVDEDDPLVTYRMPVSDLTLEGFGLMVERKFTFSKWWTSKVYAVGNITKEHTNNGIDHLNKIHFGIDNSFRLKKGWGSELNFFCEPEHKSFNGETLTTELYMSARINKRMLKNKLTTSLYVNFYNIDRDVIRDTPDLWTKKINNTNTTGLGFNITYNFKGGKKVNVKKIDSQQDYKEIKDE